MKKLFFFIDINFKKKIYLYIVIFFYLTIVLVNFFNNNYKVDSNPVNFKLNISKELSIIEKYDLYPDRECKITGNMHDRHKVRWIKNYSLEKIYQFFYNLNNISPYYINIFLHSFLIFLTFLITNKTFNYDKKYNYLFLAYLTFIFQQGLGEYIYSIFEMFFLSLALYSSKNNNIFIFFISCLLAVFNRESGFLILFSWFIFNSDIKKIIFLFFVIFIFFLILNFDLILCIINPTFFIPLENQEGQMNLLEINQNSLFTNSKLFFLNFLLPFGLFFFFFL